MSAGHVKRTRVCRRWYDSDHLATAILLRWDYIDQPAVVADALVADHGLSRAEAAELAAAARVCIARGIEP